LWRCCTGDSEGHDDRAARVPPQWLERDGRDTSSRLVLGCVHFSDDATRTTEQFRYTARVSTASNTTSTQASLQGRLSQLERHLQTADTFSAF